MGDEAGSSIFNQTGCKKGFARDDVIPSFYPGHSENSCDLPKSLLGIFTAFVAILGFVYFMLQLTAYIFSKGAIKKFYIALMLQSIICIGFGWAMALDMPLEVLWTFFSSLGLIAMVFSITGSLVLENMMKCNATYFAAQNGSELFKGRSATSRFFLLSLIAFLLSTIFISMYFSSSVIPRKDLEKNAWMFHTGYLLFGFGIGLVSLSAVFVTTKTVRNMEVVNKDVESNLSLATKEQIALSPRVQMIEVVVRFRKLRNMALIVGVPFPLVFLILLLAFPSYFVATIAYFLLTFSISTTILTFAFYPPILPRFRKWVGTKKTTSSS